MLSKKQLQDVCMAHRGTKECRYLFQDDSNYGKYYCLKLRQDQKQIIDIEIGDFHKKCLKKGLDPLLQNEPLGDNCAGYVYLKNVEQGYDKGN